MAKKSLKIYVAGPYTDKGKRERLRNVRVAIDVAIKIYKKGHFPYIPHLTHFVDMRVKEIGVYMRWEDYMKWHDVWLTICNALLYLGSSRGADQELKKAKKLGKKIFYSIKEIPIRG